MSAEPDATTEAILDATRASILDFGIRRTTLTDVARRAGVSRMTVYRRYPDVDAVLRDLMTREFGGAMAEVAARVGGEHARARIVARLSESLRVLRESPLWRKVLDAEPELLLPYVLGRMGGTQRHALELLERDVAEGQADGSVVDGDEHVIALGLLLVAQSFLLSAGIAEPLPVEALDAEFARLLDAAIRP